VSFQVNDKVVCVDDKKGHGSLEGYYAFPAGFVVKGVVYVVADFFIQPTSDRGVLHNVRVTGVPCVAVRGNSAYQAGTDVGWAPYRFRKLDEVKAENAAKRAAKKSGASACPAPKEVAR
jgi:hypothetical protein